jgi:serine/threonine-protein kinase
MTMNVAFNRRYRYLAHLGSGRQGSVHLCDDRRAPGSYVVAKLAHGEALSLESLAREMRTLRALHGSPVVPRLRALVYRKGLLTGIVTRYLEGTTLDRVLRRRRLSKGQVRSLAVAIGEAVLDIHGRGYVHRDLKPENLLVARGGGVQLLDFGLACRPSELPSDGVISGTCAYASPEQLDGRTVDIRSDLFSLGVILYELATGRMFFSCEATDFHDFVEYRARRLARGVVLEGCEPALATLIQRLLVADPKLRAGPSEVAAHLRRLRGRKRSRRAVSPV